MPSKHFDKIFLIIIQKLCFRSCPSERFFSHVKYSGVLAASNPGRSLVVLCWIFLQIFSFYFSCLTTLARANHVKYMPFFHVHFFLRAAEQEGRSKLGQILSVLLWWPTRSLPRSVPCCHRASAGGGGWQRCDGRSSCLSPLLSITLPAMCYCNIQSYTPASANGSLLNGLQCVYKLVGQHEWHTGDWDLLCER